METPIGSPKRSRFRTGLLVIVMGLLVILTISWIFDSFGASALRKAILQTQAIGGAVTLQELMDERRVWPEEENGALVIVSLHPRLNSVRKEISGDLSKRLPVLGEADLPELGGQWSPETGAAVAEFLEGAQDELAAIDTLKGYEGGRFPLQIAPNPIDTLLPSLAPLRTAARLKQLQILDRAMRGENAGLAEDITILRCHAALLRDEPLLISSLVSVALQSLAVSTVEQTLALEPIDAIQLKRIQDSMAEYDVLDRLHMAIRGERACFIAAADHIRSGGSAGIVNPPSGFTYLPGARGWLMQDEAQCIEYFNRLLVQPDPLSVIRESLTINQELAAAGGLRIFSKTLMPSLSRACQLHLHGVAELQTARVGLASERFRLSTGRWPETLDELVTNYIAAIPEDPFDPDQRLRMARRDDRLIIYSLSLNGTDDGGDVRRDPRSSMDVGDAGFILLDPANRNQPPVLEPSQ